MMVYKGGIKILNIQIWKDVFRSKLVLHVHFWFYLSDSFGVGNLKRIERI